ncbi:MAG: T9SS type A sorting domain-containing protein [Luteibaculaceae bacterium]
MNNKYIKVFGLLTAAAVVGYFSFFAAESETDYTPRKLGKVGAGGDLYYELMRGLKANVETGQIEASDFLAAQEQIDGMAFPSERTSYAWVERGPNNIAGRVRAILPFNGDTNKIIVGGVSGGLFKSVNSGLSWSKINTFSDNLSVGSLAQTLDGTILAGTGNRHEGTPNGEGSSVFHGNGLYISFDEGNTWAHAEDNLGNELRPTIFSSLSQPWSRITDMKKDPVNPNLVHIAATQGYVTYNTQTKVVTPVLTPGREGESISISSDGQFILVSLGARVALSRDAGATWTALEGNNPLPGGPGGTPTLRAEVAISPDNRDFMYASFTNSSRYLLGVWGSQDGGLTWSVVWQGLTAAPAPTNPFSQFEPFGNSLQGQGFWNHTLMAIKNQPNRIMIGGIDVWKGGFNVVPERRSRWFLPRWLPQYVHADVHRMVYDAAGVAYIGSDGGFTKSYDGLESFVTLNVGLNITQFYNMDIGPSDEIIGGTQDNGTLLIDNNALNPLRGRQVLGGDGFATYISKLNPEVMFASLYFGDVRRSFEDGAAGSFNRFDDPIIAATGGNPNLGGFFTEFNAWETDNDVNSPDSLEFTNISAVNTISAGTVIELESRNMRLPIKFTLEEDLLPGQSVKVQDRVQTLYALGLGANGVWITRDAFKPDVIPTYFRAIQSVPGQGVNAIEFCPSGDHLWVGSWGGQLWRISGLSNAYTLADFQNNITVTAFGGNTPGNAAITGIAINPNDPDDVVITVGGFGGGAKVRRATNATQINNLANFVSVQGNLPSIPVYYPVIERSNPNVLVVGTEFGIWATEDGGVNWFVANDGDMPRVPVHSLKQQMGATDKVTHPGRIYAGTHGRGFFHSDAFILPSTSNVAELSGVRQGINVKLFPNPTVSNATVEFTLSKRANATFRIMDLNGRLIRKVERPNLPAGEQVFTLNTSNLANGMYLLNIELNGTNAETVRFVVKK